MKLKKNSTPEVNEKVTQYGIYVEQYLSRMPMPLMHYHPMVEIYYVLRGRRDYFIEDRIFHVEDGDIVIIPPGMFHRTDGGTATRILVQFSPEALERHFSAEVRSVLTCLSDVLVIHPVPEEEERIGKLFSLIYTAFVSFVRHADDPTEEGRVFGLLYQLLFSLSGRSAIPRHVPISDDRLSEAVQYINENYASIRSIDNIVDHLFLSKYHLCHLFREKLGLSVITYLNNVKIRSACRMLENTDLSVSEIARECGYSSATYFCKIFREEEGMSPKKYAENVRKRK